MPRGGTDLRGMAGGLHGPAKEDGLSPLTVVRVVNKKTPLRISIHGLHRLKTMIASAKHCRPYIRWVQENKRKTAFFLIGGERSHFSGGFAGKEVPRCFGATRS